LWLDGEPWDKIKADIDTIIAPNVTHWQHPNFFAFFPCNSSYPAILGELLSAGLNVQGMLWVTSPACTELEVAVMDWLGKMVNLPKAFLSEGKGGGVIHVRTCCLVICKHRSLTFV
jgi:aromatic-L-amino-acid decarboxylase